jgi:16S rRNA (guanine527-N7)-methyltransferase
MNHILASHLAANRAMALDLLPVSRETLERLEILVRLLVQWQQIKNLVSDASVQHIWTRHIVDSLQIVPLVSGCNKWLDLGSGGGFPGLVIAASLVSEKHYEVTLIEGNSRKCSFLREAARAMGVTVSVRHARIDDVIAEYEGNVDVVSARALAPLPQLIGWTHKLLTKGAVGLFPKGQDASKELTETAKCWRLQYTTHNSLTDSHGRILRVTDAELM